NNAGVPAFDAIGFNDPYFAGDWNNVPWAPGSAMNRRVLPAKLPYGRCPSDGYNPDDPSRCNYVGSLGPQCAIGPCNYNPNQIFCDPRGNGLGDWGYSWSPDHGNVGPNDIANLRGLFNRLGTKVKYPAAITDGTSNTIMLGESLPGCHDHLTNGNWAHFN